jgi:ParB family chromosome partitioning protein
LTAAPCLVDNGFSMQLAHIAKLIELKPLSWLKPYDRNARQHSQEQVDKLAAIIAEFGFNVPILVNEDGCIIAGHGRLEAAKLLQLDQVPVIFAGHLSEGQQKKYRILDNHVAEMSSWDEEMLKEEMIALDAEGEDMDLLADLEKDMAELEQELLGAGEDQPEENPALDNPEAAGMPELKTGDREPFQQMAFFLHDEQVEIVKEAMERAKEMGPFVDSQNENSNGNALARICETFLTKLGPKPPEDEE